MGKVPGLKERGWKIVETKMVEVVPVVIVALGSVTKEFDGWIDNNNYY